MGQLKFLTRLFFINFMCMLFAFQPTAWALSTDQKSQLKNFLQRTELSKKDVSFFDYYWSLRGVLPEPVRREFATWSYLNPFLKMTQMKFQLIKDSQGKEAIQFLATQGKQSVSGTMSFLDSGEPVVKVGKTTFRMQDIQDTGKFFEKLEKEIPYQTGFEPRLNNNLVLLKADEIEKLSEAGKKEYYKNYLKLLEAAEKFQNEIAGQKTSQNLFFDLLVEKAYAQNTRGAIPDSNWGCINAGHFAHYQTNNGRTKCEVSKTKEEAKCHDGSSALSCNPKIYGKGFCVQPGQELYATKNCNEQVLGKDGNAARYYFDKIKDKVSFEEANKKVEEVLGAQIALCTKDLPIKDPSKRLDDQYDPKDFYQEKTSLQPHFGETKSACANLLKQVEVIKNTTCKQVEDLAKKGGGVPNLVNMCNPIVIAEKPTVALPPPAKQPDCPTVADTKKPATGGADAVVTTNPNNGNTTGTTIPGFKKPEQSVPEKEVTYCVKQTNPPTVPPPNPPQVEKLVNCTGVQYYATEIQCQGGTREKVQCDDGKTKYLCTCPSPVTNYFQDEVAGGLACRSKTQKPIADSGSSSREKPSKPFWKSPWVQAAFKFAIGGAILGLMYYFGKKQVQAQTEFLMPSGTPTPVPAPAPTPRPRTGVQ